jgi:predicted acetyltransferase
MMLKLERPRIELKELLFEMCADYIAHQENRYLLQTIREVEQKIDRDIQAASANPSGGLLPSITYWFIDPMGKLVGTSRLRPELNASLLEEGGNIGYDVRPSSRRLGYGTEILRLMLDVARQSGLSKLLLTCDDDNIGSAKIIEKNGGRLEDRRYLEDKRKTVRRYWIGITPE